MPGRYCFGIHLVGTRGGRIALFDQWYDAREAGRVDTPDRAEEAARAILAGFSDEEYARHVSPDLHNVLPVRIAEPLPFDEYEMVHDIEL
jgi:hypothetical protein